MPMSHFGRVADTSKRYTLRKDQSGGGRFSIVGRVSSTMPVLRALVGPAPDTP